MRKARYEWSIDWDDDNFAHPHASLPEHHVTDYRVDWGTSLDANSPAAGVSTASSGQLTLFSEDGLYVGMRPGLSAAVLELPHKWRLAVQGVTQREGRAFPILGAILGADVQPVRWRLEGASANQLGESRPRTFPTGTASDVMANIGRVADISIQTTSERTMRAIEWSGSWAGLLNALGNVLGAWPIERGDGSFMLMTVTSALAARQAAAIGIEYGIGLGESAIGIQAGLVRTRVDVEAPNGSYNTVIFGDEPRWGRSGFAVRRWIFPVGESRIPDEPNITGKVAPRPYIQIGLLDHQDTTERLNTLANHAVPGKVLGTTMPTPSGDRTEKMLVLRTTLTGGFNKVARRVLRGLGVTQPVPTASITAEPPSIQEGEFVTIRWETTNADAVTVTGVTSPPASGSARFRLTGNTVFTVTAALAGQPTATASVAVIVTAAPPAPLPTASLTVDAMSVERGSSTTLRWSSTNGVSRTLTGVNNPAASGMATVTPTQTTTYTFVVTNADGVQARATATVTVTAPPAALPTASLMADSVNINAGESTTLRWSSTNGTVTLTGVSNPAAAGTAQVSPSETTTYTLTVTNPDGVEATASVTINVAARTPSTLYLLSGTHDALYSLGQTPNGRANRVGSQSQFGVLEARPVNIVAHNGTLYMVGRSSLGGFYSLDPATGRATRIGSATYPSSYGLVSVGGTLYGGSNRLETINPATGARTAVPGAPNGFGVSEGFCTGMATDGTTVWMVGVGQDALFTLDVSNGRATRVPGAPRHFGIRTRLGSDSSVRGLAWHEGALYMVEDIDDRLHTLNTSNGRATRVGNATRFGQNITDTEGIASLPA